MLKIFESNPSFVSSKLLLQYFFNTFSMTSAPSEWTTVLFGMTRFRRPLARTSASLSGGGFDMGEGGTGRGGKNVRYTRPPPRFLQPSAMMQFNR